MKMKCPKCEEDMDVFPPKKILEFVIPCTKIGVSITDGNNHKASYCPTCNQQNEVKKLEAHLLGD